MLRQGNEGWAVLGCTIGAIAFLIIVGALLQ
jgi:hypothetical protein